MQVELQRVNDKVHFQAKNPDGNTIEIDGSERVGGEGAGFRPMQLILAGIASCSSMDLVPILAKQRQLLDDLRIIVSGERPDTVPSPFSSITLRFELFGEIDEEKARRAVELSVEKYCSVAEMLKQSVDISWEVAVNPEHVVEDR
jgi:putative redox protein